MGTGHKDRGGREDEKHGKTAQDKEDWRPFGILVKNEAFRTFYDDGQYHGGVMWLRSTHYLVKLLRMIGLGDRQGPRPYLYAQTEIRLETFFNSPSATGSNPRAPRFHTVVHTQERFKDGDHGDGTV